MSDIVHSTLTYTITRPADVVAYAVNDQVANSVTAGSVTPFQFTLPLSGNRHATIRSASFQKSTIGSTNANFRLLLGRTAFTSPGDNNGYSGSAAELRAAYLGHVDFNVSNFVSLANGILIPGVFNNQSTPWLELSGLDNGILYGVLLANGAYTPVASEVIQVTLGLVQD